MTLLQKDRKRMKVIEKALGGEVGQKAAEETALHDVIVVYEPKPCSSTGNKQTVLTGKFEKKSNTNTLVQQWDIEKKPHKNVKMKQTRLPEDFAFP